MCGLVWSIKVCDPLRFLCFGLNYLLMALESKCYFFKTGVTIQSSPRQDSQ